MEILFTLILFVILLILIVIACRICPSESTKIKRFKKIIKKNYNVTSYYVKRKKILGDYYYVFKTNKGLLTVSENGIISNVKI